MKGNLAKEYRITTTIRRPLPLNPKDYEKEEETLPQQEKTRYQSLVGSLLYINRCTRPEISIHVNFLGRRTAAPSQQNMKSALQVLQYLVSTKNEDHNVEFTPAGCCGPINNRSRVYTRWLQQLLEELGMTTEAKVYTDNEAAAKLTKTQKFHQRSRHIEHRFHYIRQLVTKQQLVVKGISGKENPADILTKLLPMTVVTKWKNQYMAKIGLTSS